jgi:hypothetical protein
MTQLRPLLLKASFIYFLSTCDAVWKSCLDIFNHRVSRLIRFQVMAKNLVDLANEDWNRKRKIMLLANEMANKKKGKPP